MTERISNSPLNTAGQVLAFVGPIVSTGGLLATLQLLRKPGQASVFFSALLAVGLVMWPSGMWITFIHPRRQPSNCTKQGKRPGASP